MASRISRRDETATERRATNVSLDTKLVAAARELGINVSRACEDGLAKQVSVERARRWQEENREAIDHYNAWIEENGIPLSEHRMF